MYCFFFKQKTAYEMRISDWSSDVCSSDLDGQQGGRGGNVALEIDPSGAGRMMFAGQIAGHGVSGSGTLSIQATNIRVDGLDATAPLELQIGRASCRERVCQYV